MFRLRSGLFARPAHFTASVLRFIELKLRSEYHTSEAQCKHNRKQRNHFYGAYLFNRHSPNILFLHLMIKANKINTQQRFNWLLGLFLLLKIERFYEHQFSILYKRYCLFILFDIIFTYGSIESQI